MKQIPAWILIALVMTPVAQASPSVNPSAKELHDQHCHQCHDDGIYTRSNSIIHSLPELKARVEFCESVNNRHWSDAQIEQVVEYLNENFYKFPNK